MPHATGWIKYLRNSASSFHWLIIFNVRCSVVRPASVTPTLISTVWCFRPYKPYSFCEDMILATCQCHSLLSWVELSYCCLVHGNSCIPTVNKKKKIKYSQFAFIIFLGIVKWWNLQFLDTFILRNMFLMFAAIWCFVYF